MPSHIIVSHWREGAVKGATCQRCRSSGNLYAICGRARVAERAHAHGPSLAVWRSVGRFAVVSRQPVLPPGSCFPRAALLPAAGASDRATILSLRGVFLLRLASAGTASPLPVYQVFFPSAERAIDSLTECDSN